MLARLGDVLYWAGCLLAILFVAAAVATYSPSSGDWVLFSGLGVVVWLIGRACRYVLAGR